MSIQKDISESGVYSLGFSREKEREIHIYIYVIYITCIYFIYIKKDKYIYMNIYISGIYIQNIYIQKHIYVFRMKHEQMNIYIYFYLSTHPSIHSFIHSSQELVHAVTETTKSQSLPSASWRTRKVGVVKGPEDWSRQWCLSLGDLRPETRISDISGQKMDGLVQEEKKEFSFPMSFCSIWASTDWMLPTHIGEERSLFSVY